MAHRIHAILFDLDGVITDTAEYHYQAWQALADAEGIPFDRAANEKLRGVSRRESLNLLLNGRVISEEQAQLWLDRKNRHYQQLLQQLTPVDLLPGVSDLLAASKAAGLKLAVVSASHNTPTVLERLGITDLFDVVIAGPEPEAGPGRNRPKPAPDLFLLAAERLGLRPAQCLVVEDAESGIAGARQAGMVTVGLGPAERVGEADLVLPNLAGVTLDQLLYACTWSVAETDFDIASQRRWESVFTIGSGYLGTRGSFEERLPGDQPSTLIHGLWDNVPIVYTELANAFDWTAVDLWVDGEPFRMDRGVISAYSRQLDLCTGELRRHLYWTSPGGAAVEICFSRLATLSDPHAYGVRVVVTPLEKPVTVRLRARLDGIVENEGVLHWRDLDQGHRGDTVYLAGTTRHTGKHLAEAMQLRQDDLAAPVRYYDCPHSPALEAEMRLDANRAWAVEKLVAIYTSRDTDDPVGAAMTRAASLAHDGYAWLRTQSREALAAFWADSDVIIEGDDRAQVAVRHAFFQLRIAAPNDERASIAAKSLSGFGYRGHVFWDTESFILPFFVYTQPALARNMLMYRWHTLEGAQRKAQNNGYAGAQYAWESAESGDEVTPRWVPGPKGEELVRIWCGDIELHITADIAYAIMQYWRATGDDEFITGPGVEIVLKTARFWESRVEADRPAPGQYAISDVIGPDEYHDHVDNNAYTNGLVRWHLRTAVELLRWLQQHAPARAAALVEQMELDETRLARWLHIADHLVFLRDPHTGLIEQFDGFFQRREVDWPAFEDRTKSMQVLLGIEGANEHQVLKQPDVLLLQLLAPEEFTPEELRANWDYYCPRTDHTYGSSLGPAIHAWMACKLGMAEEAYSHFMRAALVDLEDVRGNAREGIHAASAGGIWQALVFGFAGLQLKAGEGFTLEPRLPSRWRRLAFSIQLHGERHRVDLRQAEATVA
ncbi:MAG: beta-phosphoglucomutase [Caldilineaceae bacterium]|nr:beta-phosphoglucomutase [Caldilineaceae bacterium]